MEEQGIGRPSTYAPTISTIVGRRYVTKEKKNLYVTELGEAVNNVMKTAFKVIVDTEFTANMESLLDAVEEGTIDWKTIIRNFYPDLKEQVENAEKNLEKIDIADEESDEISDSVVSGSCAGTSETSSPLSSVSVSETFGVLCSGF